MILAQNLQIYNILICFRSRTDAYSGGVVRSGPVTIGGFLKRAQRTLLDTPWQVTTFNILKIKNRLKPFQDLYKAFLKLDNIWFVFSKEGTLGCLLHNTSPQSFIILCSYSLAQQF